MPSFAVMFPSCQRGRRPIWLGATPDGSLCFDARAGAAAKVVAQTTQPTPLESARALPEEVLAQARDVIQGSARNVAPGFDAGSGAAA